MAATNCERSSREGENEARRWWGRGGERKCFYQNGKGRGVVLSVKLGKAPNLKFLTLILSTTKPSEAVCKYVGVPLCIDVIVRDDLAANGLAVGRALVAMAVGTTWLCCGVFSLLGVASCHLRLSSSAPSSAKAMSCHRRLLRMSSSHQRGPCNALRNVAVQSCSAVAQARSAVALSQAHSAVQLPATP
ncbi:hypothetical protein PIB30_036958 [Stylosanthes scabra]|uniref:Uncharacterized protein n=1 Tax=Stylosanthes scabra TaxID=79078 RepID=A0ABU6VCE9_9FABA|nr:hypothetical protein [Stylosanthes scabra]